MVVGVCSLDITPEIVVFAVGSMEIDAFVEAFVGIGGVFLLVFGAHVTDHARQALGVLCHCQIVDILGIIRELADGRQLCHNFLVVFECKRNL